MTDQHTRSRRLAIAIVIVIVSAPGAAAELAAAGAARAPSGIQIKANRNGTIGRLLGTIRSGRCGLEAGSFRFRSGNAKLSLHVSIDDWKGYGHRYALTVGSPGKVFVDRGNTSNGAYSTEFAIPGSMAGTTAVVRFGRRGSKIRVGAPDLPDFDYSRFLQVHGAARCTRR